MNGNVIDKTDFVPVERAEKMGFATYNGGDHLCVKVPNQYSTITCELSNGEQVVFSFIPYKTGDVAPACVDIYHATGEVLPDNNDGIDRRETKAIVFENPYGPTGKLGKDGKWKTGQGYHWHTKGNAPCQVCVVLETRKEYGDRK